MKKLVVIGGGPGGNAAALTAARHGAGEVVLVERDALGGTCTNRGCIPTKFLLSRLEKGVDGAGGWPRLMAHKNALIRGLSSSLGKSCREAGVEVVAGRGRLAGPGIVEVEMAGGDVKRIETEQIVLAAGSAPAVIPGLDVDGKRIITSTEALDLPEPPPSMIVIGSGAVGSELALIFHRAGTRVTLVEAMDRLFPGEDPEVHDLFKKLYGKLGIEVVTGDMVESVEGGGQEDCRVRLASGRLLESHTVLVGVGRRLLTEGLGLETVGLETGAGGEVVVDGELRTAREEIFAVGDVTGKMLLAHLASFQGLQAGLRAIGRTGREVPYHAIPWTIFTSPEIATVGLNETAARSGGHSSMAASIPWMDNVKARIDRTTDGFVKIVAEQKTGRILGGTVVGPHASDMIHIIGTAVHGRHTVDDMAGMIFAHPGLAETIHEVLEKLLHRLLTPEGETTGG